MGGCSQPLGVETPTPISAYWLAPPPVPPAPPLPPVPPPMPPPVPVPVPVPEPPVPPPLVPVPPGIGSEPAPVPLPVPVPVPGVVVVPSVPGAGVPGVIMPLSVGGAPGVVDGCGVVVPGAGALESATAGRTAPASRPLSTRAGIFILFIVVTFHPVGVQAHPFSSMKTNAPYTRLAGVQQRSSIRMDGRFSATSRQIRRSTAPHPARA